MGETQTMDTLMSMNSLKSRGIWWKKAGINVAWPSAIKPRSKGPAKSDSHWITERQSSRKMESAAAAMGSRDVIRIRLKSPAEARSATAWSRAGVCPTAVPKTMKLSSGIREAASSGLLSLRS